MLPIVNHRYFFAFRPPCRVQAWILAAARGAGIWVSDRQAAQLHLTLCVIAELFEHDPFLAARADGVICGAGLSSCRINLGRLRAGRGGAALHSLGRQHEVRGFYAALTGLIGARGLFPLHRKSGLNAHVTLSYSECVAVADTLPIAWVPDELLLIESHAGAGRHVVLRRWPLLPPPQGVFDFYAVDGAADWRVAA